MGRSALPAPDRDDAPPFQCVHGRRNIFLHIPGTRPCFAATILRPVEIQSAGSARAVLRNDPGGLLHDRDDPHRSAMFPYVGDT